MRSRDETDGSFFATETSEYRLLIWFTHLYIFILISLLNPCDRKLPYKSVEWSMTLATDSEVSGSVTSTVKNTSLPIIMKYDVLLTLREQEFKLIDEN